LPRLTAQEAEEILLKAGFEILGSKGSRRVIIPFHSGKILHPKVAKQALKAVEEAK
jgi:predicted RNA binding protein YcfA (HicA-like mRNA interferase family)